ncbi:hypothetical protein M1D52_22000 [Olivibacter sp. SA151]|uniref:hypothetical protein n=1 Tax=Olivibacter jilunii TaxID=985016 RepID=UPI003F149595
MSRLFYFGDDIGVMIPEEWEVYQEEGVVTIYDPVKGVGALQLSLYGTGKEVDVLGELKDYLSDKYEDITVSLLNGRAYFETVDEDEVYWRYWLFLKKGEIIFVSYNCDEEEKGKETTVVDEIIRSID